MDAKTKWTEADFEAMGWHDCPVHALRIVEGEYGAGELALDIDYILEWRCDAAGRGEGATFVIAPAALTFHNVTDLSMILDYKAASAGLTPFSMDGITRTVIHGERCDFLEWTIAVNWPPGELRFRAEGYTQRLTGPSVETAGRQVLTPQERRGEN